uniref:Uncharacterized protein n=1 Tax=Denticeps clupeoides TaxID=299321 RepID=A0AAY4CVG4_9TELE
MSSCNPLFDPEPKGHRRGSHCDRQCVTHIHPDVAETPSPCTSHQFGAFTPKCLSAHRGHYHHSCCPDEFWQEGSCQTTLQAENEVEAHKLANNYKFGFKKWKSHVTERPIEDRSDVIRELYSELNFVKPFTGSLVSVGNVMYVFLFGWWVSLFYLLVSVVMFLTAVGVPYGKLCWNLSCYFMWPFGKAMQKTSSLVRRCCLKFPDCEAIPEESSPLLQSSHSSTVEMPSQPPPPPPPPPPPSPKCRVSTYVWLLLGFPVMAVIHCLACFLSWILVFSIPVEVHIRPLKKVRRVHGRWHQRIYLLPMVIITLVIGYADRDNHFVNSEVKFATAICSIIPLSYYIGMGIASISAQSNFAVGAVVNATFGSMIEMTFYFTALLRGHQAKNKCYEEIVKSALAGTLLGCTLFVPGLSMIVGGFKHREQHFNSRSAGVGSALLFISVGGAFTPTLFSKAYGNLVCEGCNFGNSTGPFICKNCHHDLSNWALYHSHIEPLVYVVSILLPLAYIIGLIFTLKTHTHIYDVHISGAHGHTMVHWSKWRALGVLILATILMAACADLTTEHIKPIISHSNVSQYFIGVTVLAMVPELPEIINGIQFALQNNMSLSLEVGSCIAVQVCMLQIPLLILFNAFYDVGFALIFSDLHLWASLFSVVLVNYIFMDGKSDYFQGTALVVVYLVFLALYFFAPSPEGC